MLFGWNLYMSYNPTLSLSFTQLDFEISRHHPPDNSGILAQYIRVKRPLCHIICPALFLKHPPGKGSREQRTFITRYRCLMRSAPQQVSDGIAGLGVISESLWIKKKRGAATNSLDSTTSWKKSPTHILEPINNTLNIVSLLCTIPHPEGKYVVNSKDCNWKFCG